MRTIAIRFLGPARAVAGCDAAEVEISQGETIQGLAVRIGRQFPRISGAPGIRWAVNRAYVSMEYALSDGDEVAIIPPVSGG